MSSFLFKFTYKMTTRHLNFKNRIYNNLFYNDLITIKDSDAKNLQLDKKHE